MTIATILKVHDGIILASDSATTLSGPGGVENIYNNANKIFNLHKGLPIGGMTYGAGSIGLASISTLAKDLRKCFMGEDKTDKTRILDKDTYTIKWVADETLKFLYNEKYLPFHKNTKDKPFLGFIVAGYSSDGLSEAWEIAISGSGTPKPKLIMKNELSGVTWRGQPEALNRLLNGYSDDLLSALQDLGLPKDQLPTIIKAISPRLASDLISSAMPIQDAIDLADFFVHTSIMYSRFSSGAPTVGGPIEIAAITKHEDFRWIRRKHYYSDKLNVRKNHEKTKL